MSGRGTTCRAPTTSCGAPCPSRNLAVALEGPAGRLRSRPCLVCSPAPAVPEQLVTLHHSRPNGASRVRSAGEHCVASLIASLLSPRDGASPRHPFGGAWQSQRSLWDRVEIVSQADRECRNGSPEKNHLLPQRALRPRSSYGKLCVLCDLCGKILVFSVASETNTQIRRRYIRGPIRGRLPLASHVASRLNRTRTRGEAMRACGIVRILGALRNQPYTVFGLSRRGDGPGYGD